MMLLSKHIFNGKVGFYLEKANKLRQVKNHFHEGGGGFHGK